MKINRQQEAARTELSEGAANAPADRPQEKQCVYCGALKPLGEFKRRSGRRAGRTGRRGACYECRAKGLGEPGVHSAAAAAAGAAGNRRAAIAAGPGAAHNSGDDAVGVQLEAAIAHSGGEGKRRGRRRRRGAKAKAAGAANAAGAETAQREAAAEAPQAAPAAAAAPLAGGAKRRGRRRRRGAKAKAAAHVRSALAHDPDALAAQKAIRRVRRPLPTPPPRPEGPDASVLTPTRSGAIKMRGKTDKGRRWVQDTDLETAVNLVREHAAVVVNRHTIRRLYSNKAFRDYILTRDRYTCYFCGEYGDTIDHLVPRAKGGHSTPINCVCACNLCNQSKADRNLDDFYTDDEAEA